MSSQFRSTRPEDGPAISAFMQQVFGMSPDNPGLDPRQMDWKYWRPHHGWEGSRGYVMERAGQIVAHGSVVPLICLWGERRVRMLDLIDWAGHPSFPGAGITLLKRVGQLVDAVFIAGGTESAQKIFPSLGFRESAKAAKFALPLRPLGRFLRDAEPVWKRAARVVRSVSWMLPSLETAPSGWSARRVSVQDVGRTSFPTPRPRAQTAVFERTPADIAFLLECPITPSEFYLVEKNGTVCGYFVLNLAVNQCRIGDAWVTPGQAEDWRALYLLAIGMARAHSAITEVVTVASNDALAREGLRLTGFRERGYTPLRVLMKGEYPEDIRYQLVDNDSAYMNHAADTYWT